ncbi:MAG: hypothetical protein ABIX28_22875 [Vicinamibacterales bacterium]
MRQVAIAAMVMMCGLGASSANAQGVVLSGAYQFLAIPEDSTVLPVGWLVSVAGSPGRVVAPVFEAGSAVRQDGYRAFQLWTVQGGARFAIPPRPAGRPRAFAQLVAGVVGAGCCGEALMYVVIEPGGGIEWPIGERTAVRVGAGFPIIVTGDGGGRLVRVHAGLSVRLGR